MKGHFFNGVYLLSLGQGTGALLKRGREERTSGCFFPHFKRRHHHRHCTGWGVILAFPPFPSSPFSLSLLSRFIADYRERGAGSALFLGLGGEGRERERIFIALLEAGRGRSRERIREFEWKREKESPPLKRTGLRPSKTAGISLTSIQARSRLVNPPLLCNNFFSPHYAIELGDS